jgi:hypothetical protein
MHFGFRPKIHRNIPLKGLIEFLTILFHRGFNGGFMIVQVPYDSKKFKRFIQFSKYIGGKKKVGLQLDYPLAEWSKPYYEKLKSVLKRNDILFDIEKTDEEGVPEFLVIDFKKDLEKAENVASLIFQELYGFSPDYCVELYFVNVNPKDEKIGF